MNNIIFSAPAYPVPEALAKPFVLLSCWTVRERLEAERGVQKYSIQTEIFWFGPLSQQLG